MPSTSELSCFLPFTPDSSLIDGLHIHAALGDGPPHPFEIDTGSVGILVPRQRLGPAYQSFDPSLDTKFQFVSSGNIYWGQWVKVPVVLGVPLTWDGTGDYPIVELEVFAVDRPTEFDGGVFGIGFGIGGAADGGAARNPLLHLSYRGEKLHGGYIIGSQGLEVGLTSTNTTGFAFLGLRRNDADSDWMQPPGSLSLPGGFSIDLPFLMDTGIDEMLLWLAAAKRPPTLPSSPFLSGVEVTIAIPPSPAAHICGIHLLPATRAIPWRRPRSSGAMARASIRVGTCWQVRTTSTMEPPGKSVSEILQTTGSETDRARFGQGCYTLLGDVDPHIRGFIAPRMTLAELRRRSAALPDELQSAGGRLTAALKRRNTINRWSARSCSTI
jgi:hypothetical protein